MPEEPNSRRETVTDARAQTSGEGVRLSAGEVVAGRFEIRGALGSGGMGFVYEAFDRKLGERRALKFARPGHFDRIPEEARAALRITHDNICRIYEIHSAATEGGEADFLSMERIEGETLFDRLRRGPLAPPERLDLARQLCRGMDAAHRAGILHLDLKPGNVMLTRRADGSTRLVIMDFGLARPSTGAEPAQGVAGTPYYLAPERLRGAEPAATADVYAIGVILREMLAGTADARWDAIVRRCLEPDPARRAATAGEVLAAIERSFGAKTRRWWIAAAVAAAAAAPVAAFRDRIWPPPVGRLALLPPEGTSGNAAADQAVRGALYDLSHRLAPVRRLVPIPFEDTLRNGVTSAALAAARLGATHVLLLTLAGRGAGFRLEAAVRDARSGVTLRRFEGEFGWDDAAKLSTSLAGVVTSAFRLREAPRLPMKPAAYAAYAAGMTSLNATPPDVARALEHFGAALRTDQNAVPALTGLALAWLERHRLEQDGASIEQAKAAAERARSLEPDSAEVLIVSAGVESNVGQLERALEHFRRAAELDPENWDVWRRMGTALLQAARNGEALDALRHAVELAPDYYVPHRDLGIAYFRQGQAGDAVREMTTVTQLAPGLAEGYLYLGAALVLAGRDDEAERALRQSIRLQPTRFALNNLAVLLHLHGRSREEIAVLQQALAAGGDDATIRLNLGDALAATGDGAAARAQWQKGGELARGILRHNPRDAASRARSGYSMVRLGQPVLGADEALQAAQLAPSDYSVVFWTVRGLEAAHRRAEIFPLLTGASPDRLRNLGRQPELAEMARDPRFLGILQKAETQVQAQRR